MHNIPKSAQLLQFRHRRPIGFNVNGFVVVQHFLYPLQRLKRHILPLKKKHKQNNNHDQFCAVKTDQDLAFLEEMLIACCYHASL